jgi:hypothetical protein
MTKSQMSAVGPPSGRSSWLAGKLKGDIGSDPRRHHLVKVEALDADIAMVKSSEAADLQASQSRWA